MRINNLCFFFTALLSVFILSSCEKEEEMALNLTGVWEGNSGITRTYKGQTLKTTKTVFVIYLNEGAKTVGYGYAIEYYDHPEMKASYHHITWNTWTRQNGDVGIELKYYEDNLHYSTVSYSLSDSEFSGKCNINGGQDQDFMLTRIANAPDLSNVNIWGYNELIPTWHQVTYEGELDVRRVYNGVTYKPTSVVITFDVDPVYNETNCGFYKAYVRENYDNAPWGTYLADSIRYWHYNSSFNELDIYLYNSETTSSDYSFWNCSITETTLSGKIFVETNVFTDFTMKRIANPDWSAIKQWGITNRIK